VLDGTRLPPRVNFWNRLLLAVIGVPDPAGEIVFIGWFNFDAQLQRVPSATPPPAGAWSQPRRIP
jgi:hypothetical protein